MKTILITGGTGFLGSSLIKKLIVNNKIILLKRSFSNTYKLKKNLKNKKLLTYNLDKINIENIFIDNHIDYIIHAATCYGRNNESLEEIIKANLLFPLNLLELSEKYKVNKFINIDTNLPNNINYYSLSKKHFSDYAKIKSRFNNIKFINLKMEHFYGPGDDNKKFIPFLIESLKNKTEINLTRGEQLRDLIYIFDIVNIFEKILEKNIQQNYYELEIGTGKTIKIKDLVIYLQNKINKNVKLNFGALEYREGEPMDEKANTTELKKIGFNSFTDIYKGLDKTIKYYNDNKN